MAKEPSAFQCDPECATQLVGAEPLLAGRQQVHSLQPDMQRDAAGLHHGLIDDREGLPSNVALAHADFVALGVQSANARGLAALTANRTIRPKPCLDERQGGNLIVEVVGAKD
jgi:hypothetical protein